MKSLGILICYIREVSNDLNSPQQKLKPLELAAAKDNLNILEKFFRLKHKWIGKILMETCLSGTYKQLSFKYFVKLFSISKLLSKLSKFLTTISWVTRDLLG